MKKTSKKAPKIGQKGGMDFARGVKMGTKHISKPGDMFNKMKAGKKKKTKIKKKISLSGIANTVGKSAKLMGNVGKAFVKNVTGGDSRAITKSWNLKKKAKKK